jgi:hypothetical protein
MWGHYWRSSAMEGRPSLSNTMGKLTSPARDFNALAVELM